LRHDDADLSEHWSVRGGILGYSFLQSEGDCSFLQPSVLPAMTVEEGPTISALQRRRQLGRRVEVAEPPPSCVELEESGFEPLIHSTPCPSVFEDEETMVGEDSGDEETHTPGSFEPSPVLPTFSPQPSSPATTPSPVFTPQSHGGNPGQREADSEANPIPVVKAPLLKKGSPSFRCCCCCCC
jgi:hypothetical protein